MPDLVLLASAIQEATPLGLNADPNGRPLKLSVPCLCDARSGTGARNWAPMTPVSHATYRYRISPRVTNKFWIPNDFPNDLAPNRIIFGETIIINASSSCTNIKDIKYEINNI